MISLEGLNKVIWQLGLEGQYDIAPNDEAGPIIEELLLVMARQITDLQADVAKLEERV